MRSCSISRTRCRPRRRPARASSCRARWRVAGRGGAEVLVRVNNDPALLADDIDGCIYPGLDGLSIPKAESAAQIHDIVARIERLERTRGLPPAPPAAVAGHRDAARAAGHRGDRAGQRSHRDHEHRRRGLLPGAGRRALGRRHRAPLPGRPPGLGVQGGRRAAHRARRQHRRASATSPPSRAPRSARASWAARAPAAFIPTRSPC